MSLSSQQPEAASFHIGGIKASHQQSNVLNWQTINHRQRILPLGKVGLKHKYKEERSNHHLHPIHCTTNICNDMSMASDYCWHLLLPGLPEPNYKSPSMCCLAALQVLPSSNSGIVWWSTPDSWEYLALIFCESLAIVIDWEPGSGVNRTFKIVTSQEANWHHQNTTCFHTCHKTPSLL